MKVAVRYLAQLRQAAGVASESVEVPGGCPLPALLSRLAERHGDSFQRLLLDGNGGVHDSILLFVGEEQVRNGTPVVLKEGDVITVLSPMAGG
jgi:MoaD family protein